MEETTIPDQVSRLYVIGDIHGRLDLLDRIVEAIGRDVADGGADALTVTLGDYVDRGPASCGVLDRLIGNPFPTPHVALRGNHEQLFESFLEDPGVADHWRRLGGLETLHSYGVPVSDMRAGRNYDEACARLRDTLPAAHRRFLQSLKTSFSHGGYFMCHAGVRPGVPLDRQSDQDLMWIREEFLTSTLDFGKIVVHGHTPSDAPEVRRNRINIDTGAFASGRLTCVVLDERGHRFLQT
ncbi:MAG: metallophosphoesterase family protein [Pseudolabrys sp.]|nr:metallophosphoesterase family protein [Pseudolabrys sp.]